MTKSLALLPPKTKPAQLEAYVVNFARMEEVHDRLKIAFQAMQGYCLTQLRAERGFELGGRPKTSESFGGFQSWPDYVKQKFGFTDDTASRHMKTWLGMQPKIAKLSADDQHAFLGLLSKPFSSFSPAHLQQLRDLTHKITDATTQTAFLKECGYLRPERTIPLKLDPANNGAAHRNKVASSFLVQEQLFGRIDQAGRMIEWWSKPIKVGNDKVPLWQTMPDHERSAFEQRLEITIRDYQQMLAQLKEAKGAKRK